MRCSSLPKTIRWPPACDCPNLRCVLANYRVIDACYERRAVESRCHRRYCQPAYVILEKICEHARGEKMGTGTGSSSKRARCCQARPEPVPIFSQSDAVEGS